MTPSSLEREIFPEMGNPHVSIRRHICWDRGHGGVASEPTSTVVLTTGNGYYIDIRLLKADPKDNHDLELQTESLSRIDWAFGGTSSKLESTTEDGGQVTQWIHWVDSRHTKDGTSELFRDIGHLHAPDDNGDTLETGRMENPETGIETAYEELWGDVTMKSTNETSNKVALVLQTATTDGGASSGRGMVIRVGQFVQGILIRNGALTLERWQHHEKHWRLKCRVGSPNQPLPCRHLTIEAPFAEGNVFEYEGVKWKVLEKQTWT